MDILTVCPGNCATGGPEALHAFTSEMNRIDGVDARIWYWGGGVDPCPNEYKSYGCDYVTEIPPDYKGVLVVPEIWANRVLDYPECIRAIYWLGVDAYGTWTKPAECGAFLEDESIIHIAQSEYAFDFLKKLGVKRILKCTDAVNSEFYAEYPRTNRNDVVLYNPAKATPFMNKLMNDCPDITFKPIRGLTRRQVIETMHSSKLYVDFGEFPGRERMPREAVLCGCCIITSKIGSASYHKDFPHDYKFESKESHIWAIANRIRYVLKHYDECVEEFYFFRQALKQDIRLIKTQCREIANEIQHYYSGI